MNRVRSQQQGYTIVETLVFLAVSGLLLVSAFAMINGQQRKNQFDTGIRDIHTQLLDIMNDTATGFYNAPNNFACETVDADGQPVITGATADLGKHDQCVFVGKALQFGESLQNKNILVYTMVGRRYVGVSPSTTTARSLNEFATRTLDTATANISLPYGITIAKAKYNFTAGNMSKTGGVVFMNSVNGTNSALGGTQNIDMFPVIFTEVGYDVKNVINTFRLKLLPSNAVSTYSYRAINGFDGSEAGGSAAPINPKTGIKICFDSGTTNQHAQILIGGSGRQVTSSLKVLNGQCPTAAGEVFTDD